MLSSSIPINVTGVLGKLLCEKPCDASMANPVGIGIGVPAGFPACAPDPIVSM